MTDPRLSQPPVGWNRPPALGIRAGCEQGVNTLEGHGLPEPGRVLAVRAPRNYPAPKSGQEGRCNFPSGVPNQGGKVA